MDEFGRWKAEQADVWLEHVRGLRKSVRRLERLLEFHEALMQPRGVAYDADKVKASPSGDAVERAVARHMELSEAYEAERDGYAEELYEAHRCIEKLEDWRYRDIITYRYLMGCKWDAVGDKVGYAADYCRELDREAKPYVYDVMPREWKTVIPRAD